MGNPNSINWQTANEKTLTIDGQEVNVTINNDKTITLQNFDITLNRRDLEQLLALIPQGLEYLGNVDTPTLGSNEAIEFNLPE